MKKLILEVAITAALAVSASDSLATCADVPRAVLEDAINAAEAAGPATGG